MNKMRRKLDQVIRAVLANVPAEEADMRRELYSKLDSVGFSAPENMDMWWTETAMILESYMGLDPDKFDGWKKLVIDIWMDKIQVGVEKEPIPQ